MVVNGHAISLSQLRSSKTVLFYVGDESKTVKIAEEIAQKKITRQ